MIDFRELVRLGAHFGHVKRRLNPKMKRYIWGCKNNVHLFDVSKTAQMIESAAKFLESVAAEGKSVLWVGTKKPAQDAVFSIAEQLKMPYVNHRWIGGTLSNFSQVKKSVTKLLHYEDILAKSESFPLYTKKELNSFNKMVERLKKNIGGITGLNWPVGAIVLVDAFKERSALREAYSVGIPVVALVDTNTDPSLVNYVIPINDDSARVIKIVMDYLGQSVLQGQKISKEEEKKKKELKLETKPKLKAEGEKSVSKDKKRAATKTNESTDKDVKKVAVTAKDSEKKAAPIVVATKKNFSAKNTDAKSVNSADKEMSVKK